MQSPETRPSLIFRLRNAADAEAWQQFVEIYRPVIIRMAIAKRMQNADAEDLAQKVLLSISTAIRRWQPRENTKFRTWLRRVAENAILNAVTRIKPDRAAGVTEIKVLLDEQPNRDSADTELLRMEYRRELFHWAAKSIRNEFTETTWNAFWLTAVEARSAAEVGVELGRNRGSIYAAKSRVMKRLVEKIAELEIQDDESNECRGNEEQENQE